MRQATDVEHGNPQLAPASSQVKATASSPDEGTDPEDEDSYSSEDEEMPMLVDCPITMLQGSSSADDSATNAEPYEQKKCGRKDCERWRHDYTGFTGDRCCELCLITSGEQHDEECTDRQALRQALYEWCCSQFGIEPPDLRSIEMHGFRPLTRISLSYEPWTFAERAQMPEMRTYTCSHFVHAYRSLRAAAL